MNHPSCAHYLTLFQQSMSETLKELISLAMSRLKKKQALEAFQLVSVKLITDAQFLIIFVLTGYLFLVIVLIVAFGAFYLVLRNPERRKIIRNMIKFRSRSNVRYSRVSLKLFLSLDFFSVTFHLSILIFLLEFLSFSPQNMNDDELILN